MSTTEKSRPRRQPEAGQRGAGQDRTNRIPVSDYTVFDSDRQQARIQNFLGHGKESAITGKRLMEITGAKDLRSVTKAIEAARRAGVPVCATTDVNGAGYFIATSPDELSSYIHSLDHRLKEIRFTRLYMGDVLEKMIGQGRLF